MVESFFDRVTRLSLRFKWVTILLAVVVLAAGVLAALDLNLELLPRVEFPQTVVVAQWSEAETAEDFLQEVTIPLEEQLSAVDGVVNVESTTSANFAFIIVRNSFGLNQERMVAAIEEAVAGSGLPPEMERPEVLNFSFTDLPVVSASVSSPDLALPELKALVDEELRPQLMEVAQVSEVQVSGGQELPEEAVADTETSSGEEASSDEEVAQDAATPTAVPSPTATPEPTATPDPARLPEPLIQGASAAGFEIESAEEIRPEMMRQLSAFPQATQFLGLLTDDNLRYLPPESIALLPPDFVETLDEDVRADLDALAAEYGGAGALAAAEESEEAVQGEVQVEPVPLPPSWTAAGEAAGMQLETTDDVTAEVMAGILAQAPQLLGDLEPEIWRALEPAAIALALPETTEAMDPALRNQLQAIVVAGTEAEAEPVDLPASWTAAAEQMGQTLETTADVTPEVVAGVAGAAPQLLQDLTPEMALAFSPEAQAALPADYVATLDEGVQQTLMISAARYQQYAAQQAEVGTEGGAGEEEGGEEAAGAEPTATPDPARLPDVLVEAAANFGQELETADDITPDLMRQLAAVPQGTQFLNLLTQGNLRRLPPESIALLPPDFVEGLDEELRADLDERAAEYGGAGALAAEEAEAQEAEEAEAEATAGEAPPLQGPWTEPNPEGDVVFEDASDILFNDFGVNGAQLLNALPTSPNVEDPAAWMAALTPEVMAYLAENEEGFVENLSPAVLEMMSPETLSFLLEDYPEAFGEELTARLEAVAVGEAEAFVPEASITRTDGDPALIVNVFKAGDANTVSVAHEIFDALEAFRDSQASQGTDVNTALVFEQATFIEDSIEGVSREGLLGAAFAVVIILIFLSGRVNGRIVLSWRSTAVTAVSIPLSVFAAFLLMRWVPPTVGVWMQDLAQSSDSGVLTFIARLFPEEVTLNIMTLSGLTVAVGRVVDDSIVVLENVYRYVQTGDDPKHAVLAGTREVAIAIFSSTATTMAVFLPLGLIGGLIGSFFLPFGLAVAYALAASFVVAITVVPALAYLLIRKDHLPSEQETWMQRWYTPILEWALHNRFLTLLITFIIFGGSLFLLGQLPRSFIPAIGEPTINVSVELAPATTMMETNEQMREFEASLQELDGIETVQTEIGSAGGFEAFFGGGGVSQNVANVTISVANQDDLERLTRSVRERAEATFGEDNAVVSAAAQTGFGGFSLTLKGESSDQLEAVSDDVRQALATVDLDGDDQPDITNISSNLDAAAGGSETIVRIDGQPAITFSGELETDNTLGVTDAAKEKVQALETVPAGVEVTEGFESEQQVEGFRNMVTAIGYSIIVVYLIMALTFRSPVHPFTILFSLPFALVGAALALYVTDSVLGISAMIGLMMLVGIVVTNAIVLMELVQQLRARGRSAYEALVEAGRTRLRPIWMTALTAVLALAPLAASEEGGALIASELARAVIGGLLVSTALTLIVVPVVYSLFEQLAQRLRPG